MKIFEFLTTPSLNYGIIVYMYCTGQAGVFTATSGLQLAYLSGRYSEQDYTASTKNKSLVGIQCTYMCIYINTHTYIHMYMYIIYGRNLFFVC